MSTPSPYLQFDFAFMPQLRYVIEEIIVKWNECCSSPPPPYFFSPWHTAKLDPRAARGPRCPVTTSTWWRWRGRFSSRCHTSSHSPPSAATATSADGGLQGLLPAGVPNHHGLHAGCRRGHGGRGGHQQEEWQHLLLQLRHHRAHCTGLQAALHWRHTAR